MQKQQEYKLQTKRGGGAFPIHGVCTVDIVCIPAAQTAFSTKPLNNPITC